MTAITARSIRSEKTDVSLNWVSPSVAGPALKAGPWILTPIYDRRRVSAVGLQVEGSVQRGIGGGEDGEVSRWGFNPRGFVRWSDCSDRPRG